MHITSLIARRQLLGWLAASTAFPAAAAQHRPSTPAATALTATALMERVNAAADMMERAQLKSLGYESIHEALGKKLHCSPKAGFAVQVHA